MRFLNSRQAIYWILALGFAVRVIPLVMAGGSFLVHENPSYDAMSLQLIAHEKFSPYWPPGLPYYLAFWHIVFGPGMLVARASVLVLYGAFSVLLYMLVRDLSSPWAANLAVLTFAVYPSYVRYAFNPSTEYPTAVCLLTTAYLAMRFMDRPRYWQAVLLGLVLGALALIRPNSLGLTVIVPLYLLIKTGKWKLASVSVVVSCVLVGAWLWKAKELTGRFVFINGSNEENFVFANHPDTPLKVTCRDCPEEWDVPASFLRLEREIDFKPSPERQRVLRAAAIQYVVARPDLFLVRMFNRLRAYFTFPVHYADPLMRRSGSGGQMRRWAGVLITVAEACFFWPILTLAIVFLFDLPSFSEARNATYVVRGIAGVYALPCWLTWSQARYAFPVIPLFAVLAFVFLNALRKKPWREVASPILLSRPRRTALILTLGLFVYIQAEWIVLLVRSGTWQKPIQRMARVASIR